MTLQTSIRRPPIALIDVPGPVIILAIVWLLIEDLFKVSKPLLLRAGAEIKLTVENDPTYLEIRQSAALFPFARTFCILCIAFSVIEIWS